MQKRIAGVVSLLVLIGSYLLFSYPLLDLHGMKQWPLVLMIPGVIVIVTVGAVLGKKFLPVFTVAGYILGFFCGFLFQSDYYDSGGGRLNTMWIIWTVTYLAVIAAGCIVEIIKALLSKKADISSRLTP